MWKIVPYVIVQSILLVGGQVFLKLALTRMPAFAWTRAYWWSLVTNWHFAACGVLFSLASLLWMYITKQFPFSTAYPMVSLSYVFGMLAAIAVFHEEVPVVKWIGVLLIVTGCMLTCATPAQAQQHGQQARQEISQAAAALKTLQCEFTQTKHMRMLNDKMVSTGHMYYRQSDCLRWEYVKPYTYTFVLNGDKVLLKNRQRNDVIDIKRNKVFREIAHIMLQSVAGNCLNDDSSFTSSTAVDGGDWVVTLRPLRKDIRQLFREIVLRFSRQKAVVTRVELTEKNGDSTVIELRNVKKNETIAHDMFALH